MKNIEQYQIFSGSDKVIYRSGTHTVRFNKEPLENSICDCYYENEGFCPFEWEIHCERLRRRLKPETEKMMIECGLAYWL